MPLSHSSEFTVYSSQVTVHSSQFTVQAFDKIRLLKCSVCTALAYSICLHSYISLHVLQQLRLSSVMSWSISTFTNWVDHPQAKHQCNDNSYPPTSYLYIEQSELIKPWSFIATPCQCWNSANFFT